MNILKLTAANLKEDLFGALMNLTLLSLGVATIIIMLLAAHQVEDGFFRNARGIDLVVGAKGSPLQIILSSIYQMDVPTGNIPLEDLRELRKNPAVKTAVPVSMGDNYYGFRIVGTEAEYLNLYDLTLATGRVWDKALEATIGAEVARTTGLKMGDSFAGAHGLADMSDVHKHTPYTVVGILNPSGTIADRLILTSIESAWKVHEFHDDDDQDEMEAAAPLGPDGKPRREVTAALIQYSSPIAAISLPRAINSQSSLQAAIPAFEISRLLSLLNVGIQTLKAFGAVFLLVAGIGVFAALYKSLRERRYELAIMRVQGASRTKLFSLILIEGLLLGFFGSLLGVLLGHAAAYCLASMIGTTLTGTGVSFLPAEAAVVGAVMLLALAAAIIPAIMAYRTDIAEVLAKDG